jgi:2-polyprenyl-3-methyl-5-hydroxy-6-metoxy-1,4-benzoquinol methylase
MGHLKCWICGGNLIDHYPETYTIREIFKWWSHEGYNFSQTVLKQFNNDEKISLNTCQECGFGMFIPPVVGSDEFYGELAEMGQSWYYLKNKWEYGQALVDLKGCQNILDVGCGEGHFVELAEKQGMKATGLELNRDAAAKGRSKNLSVDIQTVEEFSLAHSDQFDGITLFQVLEHLKEPVRTFLHTLQCLKNSGKIVITVPSTEGFLKSLPPQLANVPPHHVSRWSCKSIEKLASRHNLRILTLRHEPFWHYGFVPQMVCEYIRRKTGIDLWNMEASMCMRKIINFLWRAPYKTLLLSFPKGIPMIRGHSLYAVLQK